MRRTTDESVTFEVCTPLQKTVKISFFGTKRFGRLRNPEITDDQNLLVASSEGIFSLKLKTLLQRTSYKDYKDIAGLIRAGYSLKEALEGAMAIFGNMFSPAIAIGVLNYFDDVQPPLNKKDQHLLREATKEFLKTNIELFPSQKISQSLSFKPTQELLTTEADRQFAKLFATKLGLQNSI